MQSVNPASTIKSQEVIDELHARSNEFYETSVRGKKLDKLKYLADGTKERMFDALHYFLDNRKPGEPPNIILLADTLEALRNLRLVYSEMELQEGRIIIKAIRKIGANPKVTGLATVITICLAGYTIISFGVVPDSDNNAMKQGLIISGVIAVGLGVFAAIISTYLQRKYDKVKISEKDILERAYITRYFRHFGKMEFNDCITLIAKMGFEQKIELPYRCEIGLKNLAQDCNFFKDHPDLAEHAKKYSDLPNKPESLADLNSASGPKKSRRIKHLSPLHNRHHDTLQTLSLPAIPAASSSTSSGPSDSVTLDADVSDDDISFVKRRGSRVLKSLHLEEDSDIELEEESAAPPQLLSRPSEMFAPFNFADSDDECNEMEKEEKAKVADPAASDDVV